MGINREDEEGEEGGYIVLYTYSLDMVQGN